MSIAGPLRINEATQRVLLEGAGPPVPDGDGGFTDSFGPLDPPHVFAKIEPASAQSLERLTSGTVTTTATHTVTMPFHPAVTTQTRVSWTDVAGRPHTANIVSVVNLDEACHTSVLIVAEQVK